MMHRRKNIKSKALLLCFVDSVDVSDVASVAVIVISKYK